MIDLEDAYRYLANALDRYTDDVELSGTGDTTVLEKLLAIPKYPASFDQHLWDEMVDDDETDREDLATLVRLAVLHLQDAREANGLKRSLHGKGLKHWRNLCDHSRLRTSAKQIYESAIKLDVWAEKQADKLANANVPTMFEVMEAYVRTEGKASTQAERIELIAPLLRRMGYKNFKTFVAAAQREDITVKTVKERIQGK